MDLRTEEIRERLLRLGFPPVDADEVAQRLMELRGQTRQALEHWLETGEVDSSLGVEGYTLPRLMEEFGMTFPAALLTLEWIMRSPEEAIPALERGIDIVL